MSKVASKVAWLKAPAGVSVPHRRVATQATCNTSCLARTSFKSNVLALMEAGYFSGSEQSCRLLVDLEETSAGEVAGWRNMGSLGGEVFGVDGAGDVWVMEEGHDEPVACVGMFRRISSAEDATGLVAEVKKRVGERMGEGFMVIVDALDWRVIPVENLLAAFAHLGNVELVMACGDAGEALLMRDVMEVGVDGVLADVDDRWGARAWARFVQEEFLGGGGRRSAAFSRGVVTEVVQVGMGDRICVDLAENMVVGEGMLVGSFARGVFLVHSEVEETEGYITPRAFRVNAGPPHSYIEQLDDRLGYLGELESGSRVAVFDWSGRVRGAVVGRIKLERRPLVRISAQTAGGVAYSVMLQVAETVKLVGPGADGGFRTVSVTEIKEGDEVFLLEHAEAARHTGVAIEETIKEY